MGCNKSVDNSKSIRHLERSRRASNTDELAINAAAQNDAPIPTPIYQLEKRRASKQERRYEEKLETEEENSSFTQKNEDSSAYERVSRTDHSGLEGPKLDGPA